MPNTPSASDLSLIAFFPETGWHDIKIRSIFLPHYTPLIAILPIIEENHSQKTRPNYNFRRYLLTGRSALLVIMPGVLVEASAAAAAEAMTKTCR